jgi:hypothetical protein
LHDRQQRFPRSFVVSAIWIEVAMPFPSNP